MDSKKDSIQEIMYIYYLVGRRTEMPEGDETEHCQHKAFIHKKACLAQSLWSLHTDILELFQFITIKKDPIWKFRWLFTEYLNGQCGQIGIMSILLTLQSNTKATPKKLRDVD
jgi:hypothetical protein